MRMVVRLLLVALLSLPAWWKADLSISLGVPGEFQHPKMVEAMEAVRDSCRKHGVAPGTQTRTLELGKFWRDRGMLFLGCNSETGMLFERASEITAALR